jgi:hypothetical protein
VWQGRASLLRHCVFSLAGPPRRTRDQHESRFSDSYSGKDEEDRMEELVPSGDLWWLVFFLGGARLGQWVCSDCSQAAGHIAYQESHITHIELVNYAPVPIETARLKSGGGDDEDAVPPTSTSHRVNEVSCRNCSKLKTVSKSLGGVRVGWLLDTACNFEWKEPLSYVISASASSQQ